MTNSPLLRRRLLLFSPFILSFAASFALAADALTEDQAKALIAKYYGASLDDFQFAEIQIAAPRKLRPGEYPSVTAAPNADVTLVKAAYSQATGGDLGRDHVQSFMIFADDFGALICQPIAVPSNTTSDLKKVR